MFVLTGGLLCLSRNIGLSYLEGMVFLVRRNRRPDKFVLSGTYLQEVCFNGNQKVKGLS